MCQRPFETRRRLKLFYVLKMKKKKLSDVVVREEYGTAEVQTCPPGASQPQGNSSGSSLQPCAAVPVSALKVRMKTLVPKKLQAKALMGTTEGSSAEEKLFFPGYRILNYYQVGQRVKLNLEMNLTLENGKMVHLIWLCRRSQVEPNTWWALRSGKQRSRLGLLRTQVHFSGHVQRCHLIWPLCIICKAQTLQKLLCQHMPLGISWSLFIQAKKIFNKLHLHFSFRAYSLRSQTVKKELCLTF